MPDRSGLTSGKRVSTDFAIQAQLVVEIEKLANQIGLAADVQAGLVPKSWPDRNDAEKERARVLARRVLAWVDPSLHDTLTAAVVLEVEDYCELKWAHGSDMPSSEEIAREACAIYAAKQAGMR